MAHLYNPGTLTEEISEKTFRKERRRLQAKHLWMEVKLSWHVLADRMYTAAPTGKSREQLYALLFNKAARGSQKNAYEEKAYRGPALKAVQAWWEQCKEWMLYFKGQSAPLVQDLQGLLQAFRGKEEVARAEVEAFMEHCAKRWRAERGAICFTLVSHYFANFHWLLCCLVLCVVVWLGCCCLFCFLGFSCENSAFN